MIFATPWLLAILAGLPALWWLLRAVPPAPRTEIFPALRLLAGLESQAHVAARTPWWLLMLRLVATALAIIGFANPILHAAAPPPGNGPLLVVIDNGWASAPDWPDRLRAANTILDRAERAGRQAALMATAPENGLENGLESSPANSMAGSGGITITPVMPVRDLRPRLAALRPTAWPEDHPAAARAMAQWRHTDGWTTYIASPLAQPGDPDLAASLTHSGQLTVLRGDAATLTVLRPPAMQADKLTASVLRLSTSGPAEIHVLAQGTDGRILARATGQFSPGSTQTETSFTLPAEIRNRLGRLVLEAPPSAAHVALLDEASRHRPVGLVSPEESADAPLTGALFYVRRALAPSNEIREGSVATLLSRDISVIVLADQIPTNEDAARLEKWVKAGGMLIRFAGPRLAASRANAPSGAQPTERTQDLLPQPLMAGDRSLGGALSWSQPAQLAPFPSESPFAGLSIPKDVTVKRQVLAEPSAQLNSQSWARLTDGTPLVTQAQLGAGRVVLFHVTANADWSNLPLSGLFPDMMRRLADMAAGVASAIGTSPLAPVETLDGFGTLGPAPDGAQALTADDFTKGVISPQHPPGYYGPPAARRAFNLGQAVAELQPSTMLASHASDSLTDTARETRLGPWLLGLALLLLALDLPIALRLRGLLPALCVLFALLAPSAQAQMPALHTRLAYVVTGDATQDELSRNGLTALSEYVNHRTAAHLAMPAAVVPGKDDLSFYPLLYWPIIASAQHDPSAVTALNEYMRHGGIILIDTRDSGSGQGYAPGTDAALRRVTQGLDIPPLAMLTTDHVLARSFYLLPDFPGRFAGGDVWVQRDQDPGNDSVSPVIIGGHDWAAAWAVDADGMNPYATIPGGLRQRTMAYRFGVNLVMYALTGNYKADQLHVPALLERLHK